MLQDILADPTWAGRPTDEEKPGLNPLFTSNITDSLTGKSWCPAGVLMMTPSNASGAPQRSPRAPQPCAPASGTARATNQQSRSPSRPVGLTLAPSRLARVRDPKGPLPHGHVRRHATVLFTDIEESTAHLVQIGDDAWTHLLEAHNRTAARLVRRHDGLLIKTTGDGILALFWDAGGALRCARRFIAEAAELGVSVRSGLHSGPCLLAGRDVSGLTVHIAARVARLAQGGEVRISEATRELLDEAPDELTDCGPHELKGVPGKWRVFAVTATCRCAPIQA